MMSRQCDTDDPALVPSLTLRQRLNLFLRNNWKMWTIVVALGFALTLMCLGLLMESGNNSKSIPSQTELPNGRIMLSTTSPTSTTATTLTTTITTTTITTTTMATTTTIATTTTEQSDRVFTNMQYLSFLTILALHHEEIVDNGLITYHQEGKSCNIVLQTKTKNFICNWQLGNKNIFKYHLSQLDGNEYLEHFQHFENIGFTFDDYLDLVLNSKLEIAKFATFPRAHIYWLENIAPKSHGVTNVTCKTENETITNLDQLMANYTRLFDTSGIVDLTATVTGHKMPGIALVNAKENQITYETRKTRYDCGMTMSTMTPGYVLKELRFVHYSLNDYNCSTGPPTIKYAELVNEAYEKLPLEEKIRLREEQEQEEQRRKEQERLREKIEQAKELQKKQDQFYIEKLKNLTLEHEKLLKLQEEFNQKYGPNIRIE